MTRLPRIGVSSLLSGLSPGVVGSSANRVGATDGGLLSVAHRVATMYPFTGRSWFAESFTTTRVNCLRHLAKSLFLKLIDSYRPFASARNTDSTWLAHR